MNHSNMFTMKESATTRKMIPMDKPVRFMWSISPDDGRRIVRYAKKHNFTALQVMTWLQKKQKPSDINLYYPHPGEVLRHEFLPRARMTGSTLASQMKLPLQLIRAIMGEKEPVTKDMAQRLGEFFRTSPRYWMKLQWYHDSQNAQVSASAS